MTVEVCGPYIRQTRGSETEGFLHDILTWAVKGLFGQTPLRNHGAAVCAHQLRLTVQIIVHDVGGAAARTAHARTRHGTSSQSCKSVKKKSTALRKKDQPNSGLFKTTNKRASLAGGVHRNCVRVDTLKL